MSELQNELRKFMVYPPLSGVVVKLTTLPLRGGKPALLKVSLLKVSKFMFCAM